MTATPETRSFAWLSRPGGGVAEPYYSAMVSPVIAQTPSASSCFSGSESSEISAAHAFNGRLPSPTLKYSVRIFRIDFANLSPDRVTDDAAAYPASPAAERPAARRAEEACNGLRGSPRPERWHPAPDVSGPDAAASCVASWVRR